MSMNVGMESTSEDETIVDINTTPLIDVMLVLLIMLIITIPLQTQSVQLVLARSATQPTMQPERIELGIDFDNSLSWNHQPVTNEQQLQALLKNQSQKPETDQAVVEIKPNRLASYQTVAHVLADAQRLGIKKLTIFAEK